MSRTFRRIPHWIKKYAREVLSSPEMEPERKRGIHIHRAQLDLNGTDGRTRSEICLRAKDGKLDKWCTIWSKGKPYAKRRGNRDIRLFYKAELQKEMLSYFDSIEQDMIEQRELDEREEEILAEIARIEEIDFQRYYMEDWNDDEPPFEDEYDYDDEYAVNYRYEELYS